MSDEPKFEKANLGEGVYVAPGEMGIALPCGCRRSFIKRMAPTFDEQGAPKLEADGAFIMEEITDVQESYCDEHTKGLIERQQEVRHALESGADSNEALRLFAGASPFPQLTDGSDE